MVIEHDDRGKFKKGNRGGPGRPKKETETKFYDILVTAITADDWERIILKARDQAIRGDAVARKFLADYLIGPPVQKNEHSGPDGEKLTIKLEVDDARNND